jgi:hypothetical protein
LVRAGLLEPDAVLRPAPVSIQTLLHDLQIRDFRIWLERSATGIPGVQLRTWYGGEAAAMDLGGSSGRRWVRPDARFLLEVGSRVLSALLEIDTGSEAPGGSRWCQKRESYGLLIRSERLVEVTGFRNVRLVIMTRDARRREQIAMTLTADAELAARTWITDTASLQEIGLCRPIWQQPGAPTALKGLLPVRLLQQGADRP